MSGLNCTTLLIFIVLLIVPHCFTSSASLRKPPNNDLLVTLKGLHQTLAKLVDSLASESSRSENKSKIEYSPFVVKNAQLDDSRTVDRNFIPVKNKDEVTSTPRSASEARPFQVKEHNLIDFNLSIYLVLFWCRFSVMLASLVRMQSCPIHLKVG